MTSKDFIPHPDEPYEVPHWTGPVTSSKVLWVLQVCILAILILPPTYFVVNQFQSAQQTEQSK